MAFEGYPIKPGTAAKMNGVGNPHYMEGYIKVDTLCEMPGNLLIPVLNILPTTINIVRRHQRKARHIQGMPPEARRYNRLSW